jgi:glycerophosphoryl diester phosphodiesterase
MLIRGRTLAGIAGAGLGLALCACPMIATGSGVSGLHTALTGSVTCVAHRGSPTNHTEETVPTYTEAIAERAGTIDGDIRFSDTNYPVMLHDSTLDEFGSSSKIADVSVTTAQTHKSSTGDVMATLYQVTSLLAAHPDVRWEFELKTVPTSAQWTVLNSRLASLKSRGVLTSFNESTVSKIEAEGYRAGWLVESDQSAAPAGLNDQLWTSVDAAHVRALSTVGVSTEAWSPDTVAAWNTLYGMGVRTLNTDDVVGCMNWATAEGY